MVLHSSFRKEEGTGDLAIARAVRNQNKRKFAGRATEQNECGREQQVMNNRRNA